MSTTKHHTVTDPETDAYIATVFPASQQVVDLVMARPPDTPDSNNRSGWVWMRLADGTLILGVFPQGDTYMEIEDLVEQDRKTAEAKAETPAMVATGIATVKLRFDGTVRGEHYLAEYLAEALEVPQADGAPFNITDVVVDEITQERSRS